MNQLVSAGCCSFYLHPHNPASLSCLLSLTFLVHLILISYFCSSLVPFSVGLEPALLHVCYKNPVPQGICSFRKESESREGIDSGSPHTWLDKYNTVIKTLHGPMEAPVYRRRLADGECKAPPFLSWSPLCHELLGSSLPLSRWAQEPRRGD